MSLFIKSFPYITIFIFLAILNPTSLANLVVEMGTKHCHQISLSPEADRCIKFFLRYNFKRQFLPANLVHFLSNCTGMNANNLKSTLVQVMAWCRQTPSHYLNRCYQYLCHYKESLGRNQLNTNTKPGQWFYEEKYLKYTQVSQRVFPFTTTS